MLFPLSKVCATVGASSLPQGKTADEPKGEQDDGQEDAQEGEGVLQNPDPAEREGARGLGPSQTQGLPAQRTPVPKAPPAHVRKPRCLQSWGAGRGGDGQLPAVAAQKT